jgi:cation transport ATPase
VKNILPHNFKARLNKDVLKSHLTYLNIIGVIIFVIGLLLLYYVYISSFYFLLGLNGFNDSWIIRLAYLISITIIGGFFIKQAIELLGDSRVISIIILTIGLVLLLFAFWTAQFFVKMPYQFNAFILVGLLFFGIMIAIGMFFFGKGMADLIKIRKTGVIRPTESPSENIPPPETGNTEKGIPPDHPQAEFKICPKCLSPLSLDDTHCIFCGKKQE